MEPFPKSKNLEIKSVWANGEDVIGPIEAVSTPTGELPYWKITLKDGSLVNITGQVIVKWGPKT
ncbi:MAG: hypothetical protein ABSG44_10095 [Thermodesulfobacteriota bacterium]|jgi:hypothetical protein